MLGNVEHWITLESGALAGVSRMGILWCSQKGRLKDLGKVSRVPPPGSRKLDGSSGRCSGPLRGWQPPPPWHLSIETPLAISIRKVAENDKLGNSRHHAMILRHLRGNGFLRFQGAFAPPSRSFSATQSASIRQMPLRPKPPPDSEIEESFLKGSGPGGQKIVSPSSLPVFFSSEARAQLTLA